MRLNSNSDFDGEGTARRFALARFQRSMRSSIRQVPGRPEGPVRYALGLPRGSGPAQAKRFVGVIVAE